VERGKIRDLGRKEEEVVEACVRMHNTGNTEGESTWRVKGRMLRFACKEEKNLGEGNGSA